uniref:Actin filament-associated protein 1-like 2 n=1 Tax=Xiphophorus couchianus TaxID=32473 RepID=A0A3B5LKG3_9TELE
MELHRFLLILDRETLSGNATVQKGLLSDLLQSYRTSGGKMKKYYRIIRTNLFFFSLLCICVADDHLDALVNGKAAKFVPVPQKSLPDLPPPRTVSYCRFNCCLCVFFLLEDGDAVSSSYESYDEEEVTREKSPSAQHQWPSAEASIELMKDARICAFLWRKKWLGQWAKQLCVIKDHRLLCYKSSKDQTPLLDVSLLGCSVIYKEKQPKKKEHRLKIIPVGGEAIVLGLQSKEQTEQWLKVIQEISPKPAENCDPQHSVSDSPRLICTKGDLNERHSLASESGSSTDSHTETTENKDVKKKYGPGLMFSNLMNIGKKKPSSLESPEKSLDTSGYLNVLVNSQWRTCWCLIKNGQLWFYQDKGKNKVSQPAVTLEGCSVLPDPIPEHLYSFRIQLDGTQIATLEAKTSADMGHWLGLLLSQTGTKTDPEDLTYDYVDSERVSTIVTAAKTSFHLMQRRYSESNTYIDTLPSIPQNSDEIYDDVASIADPEDHNATQPDNVTEQDSDNRIYLDLVPMRSFLHTACGAKASPPLTPRVCPIPGEGQKDSSCQVKEVDNLRFVPALIRRTSSAVEIKLGKNRTEADLLRYIDERDRLEKQREEVRSSLANLKKEKRETKEELSACQDPKQQVQLEACLKQKEEACREAERRRVEVELRLVEVKESLKKVESGPFTLGTTLDSSLQDSLAVSFSRSKYPGADCPVNSALTLKNRPTSIIATKGNVLQKAKEWEKKSTA